MAHTTSVFSVRDSMKPIRPQETIRAAGFLLLFVWAIPSLCWAQEPIFGQTPAWTGPAEDTRSVALGDVDGDGDLDLVRGNHGRGATLHRNMDGTFESAVAWTGPIENTRSVALGDVDGDGDLDLVLGNFNQGATLYRNTGGIFESTAAWRGPDESTVSVALGDVDGDGDLDLVRGNMDQGATLYRNTGGTFESSPVWTGPVEDTRSVALGDVDGDGDLDLVRGNHGAGATLYRNTGGTFELTPAWTGPAEKTLSVALGDVDGDGDLDLVRGNYVENTRTDVATTLYRNTGGTFEPSPAWTGPLERTTSVALGDVDGDGDLDLVRGNGVQGATLYRSTGGIFESSPAWTGPVADTWSVALGDVDGDGSLDLVLGSPSMELKLYRNTTGAFGASPPWTGPAENTWSVALGDVDSDGDLDLVRGNGEQGATLYRTTDGVLESLPAWTSLVEDAHGVALGDVDGDGDLDLVLGNENQGATLYRNTGGTFDPLPAWTGPGENTKCVALGDVDGDGDLDLVRGNKDQGATLYRNTGGTFEASPFWTGPVEATWSVALGDVDGDGDLDLVRGNDRGSTLHRNTGGTFEASPAWTGPPELTRSVVLGDVDGDGDLDLVQGNFLRASTLHRNTGGTFESLPSWTGPEGVITWSVELRDVDGDGDLDLVRGFDRGATLHRNTGGTFESSPAWTGPAEDTRSIALGDVDGDGKLDLVRGNLGQGATLYPGSSPWKNAGVPYLGQVRPLPSDDGVHRLRFAAFGEGSDPLWIVGHYQFEGTRVWYPMEFDNSRLPSGPWTTSPEGVVHEVLWNSGQVPPDPRDVIIRLRAVATPGGAGIAQFIPYYLLNMGPLNFSVSSLAQRNSRGDFPVGEETRVTVLLPTWAPFREGQLYYRAGGSAGYDSTELMPTEIFPGVFIPVGTIPPEDVGPRGLEYWVRVRAYGRTTTDPPIEPELRPRFVRTKFIRLEENLPEHGARRYRMVSVPADLELGSTASLAAVLSDEPEFGPPDPLKWRAFRYAPADSAYLEVTAASDDGRLSPLPGRAFWLISREPHRIDTSPIPGLSVPTDSAYRVVLLPGWNQVGDPFDFPVSWSEVTWEGSPEAVEPPLGWDESGQKYESGDVATLEPFNGYWIKNTTDRPVTLLVPPREATSQGSRPVFADRSSKASQDDWSVQIIASSGSATDERNFAGVAGPARQGTDPFDRSDPPHAPGEAISLYFLVVDRLNAARGECAIRTVDIRPPIDGLDEFSKGSQWVFDVALTGIQEPREVALMFKNLAGVPSELQIRIVDRELDRTIDLRKQNSYRYIARPNVRIGRPSEARFEFLVGTQAYLDANHPVRMEPQVTRLLPNFPNPFDAETIIRFELSKPGPVTVSVFDVGGGLVRVVTDGRRDTGVHETLWNGENEYGGLSPAGIYFVRLVTSEGSETRKVVRLSGK